MKMRRVFNKYDNVYVEEEYIKKYIGKGNNWFCKKKLYVQYNCANRSFPKLNQQTDNWAY
eukprot:Pgem_evm2s1382